MLLLLQILPPGYFDPKGPAPHLTGVKGDVGDPGAPGVSGPPGIRVSCRLGPFPFVLLIME